MSTGEIWSQSTWNASGRVFILEIAGIGTGTDPVRYYSGPTPSGRTDTGSSKAYIQREAITGVSADSSSIARGGGIADYAPVIVTLAKLRSSDAYGPGTVLERVDWRHMGTAYARQLFTLEATDTAGQTVYLDRNPTVIGAFPRAFHLGGECCWGTATAGDGTTGNEWRITGVTRGIRGTFPLTHFVGTRESARPFVTAEAVSWQNRRAVLYAARRRLDGSVSTFVVARRGFLTAAPRPDGDSVTVSIEAAVAVTGRKLGGDGRHVGLHPSRHVLEGSAACILQYEAHWPDGHAFSTQASAATAVNVTPILCQTTEHDNVFDVTLPTGHPRIGRLLVTSADGFAGAVEVEPTGYNAAPGFDVVAAESPGSIAGAVITNVACWELHKLALVSPADAGTESILSWRADFIDAINAIASAWNTGDRDGLGGSFMSLGLATGADLGLTVHYNRDASAGNTAMTKVSPIHLHFWGGDIPRPDGWGSAGAVGFGWGRDWSTGVPQPLASARQALHYPIDLAEPDQEGQVGPEAITADFEVGRPAQRGGRARGVVTVGVGTGWARSVVVHRGSDLENPIRIRGICEGGWYQTGELYVSCDADLTTPAGGYSLWIRVRWVDHLTGDDREARAEVIDVTEVEAGLWRLKLSSASRRQLPSFGDWSALDTPVRISPTLPSAPATIAEQILRILMSTGGQAIGGNGRDRLSFGMRLQAEDVDVASFLAFAVPPQLNRWAPVVPEDGVTLGDLLAPMLRAIGGALVMRRDEQGRERVALVSVTAPSRVEALESALTDADWTLARPPGSDTTSDVITTRRYETDHAELGEGDPMLVFAMVNNAAVAAAGGPTDVEVLELRGINLRNAGVPGTLTVMQVVDARLSASTAFEQRIWAATTTTPRGWLLYPGAGVAVTSDYLKGFSDSVGVSDELARVMAIRTELWEDGAALTMHHFGAKLTGVNLALKVTASTAVDKVTIGAAGTWAPAEHPVTGATLDPLTYLAVGHVVDAMPFGDHDGRTAGLTVAAIDLGTRIVTLSGAHGLAGPMWGGLVWTTYDNAPAVGQNLAYIADGTPALGAGNAPGYEWA